jgi:hypothetical protein
MEQHQQPHLQSLLKPLLQHVFLRIELAELVC